MLVDEEKVINEFKGMGYILKEDTEEYFIFYKDNNGEYGCSDDDMICFYKKTSSFSKTDGSGVGIPNSYLTEKEQKLLYDLCWKYM